MLDELLKNEVIALFAILVTGLLLGKITIKGISLGSSGVLFTGLFFGHFGYGIPNAIGKIGLVLFVYCIGISAGPTFFASFAKRGIALAKLSVITVLSGAVVTVVLAKIFNVQFDLAAGLFAGALTSTPGLASAIDVLKTNPDNLVSIGYGIGYPFGVVGVILFIQILPKILKVDLDEIAKEYSSSENNKSIKKVLVEITNKDIFDCKITSFAEKFESLKCCITRVYLNNKLEPVNGDTILREGDIILLLGMSNELDKIIPAFGIKSKKDIPLALEEEKRTVVVTSNNMIAKSINEIKPLSKYGITISRIINNDISRIALGKSVIEYGDTLLIVGNKSSLDSFAKAVGHKRKALHITDLSSLLFGILLGIIIGQIQIPIPGMSSFALGMTGGPLFVALILGYFRRIGKISGQIPQAARILLMELGLVFFLASAGCKAGGKFMTIFKENGLELILVGGAITIVPVMVGYIIARKFLNLNILEALGGICGGMTSTPSLGALSAKVDSEIPTTSYATAYPVALIFMTIATQIVIAILK